jgi:hypothetical protein
MQRGQLTMAKNNSKKKQKEQVELLDVFKIGWTVLAVTVLWEAGKWFIATLEDDE